jgi:arylsulfatase A-like enzyme
LKFRHFFSLAAALLALAAAGPVAAARPDLVLLVTVDQLRGDMPWKFRGRFGPAGFRYLMDKGTVYTNAHYRHLVTTTAAGHATLVTGGNTPQHGIASNEWFDIQGRMAVYNTGDRRHPVIGDTSTDSEGRSPANLTSSTFGDELVEASGGKSRVFSVSIKDRAAIIPGGRHGKAWWYSKTSGEFVTSTWYGDEYPAWVQNWNDEGHADRYRDQSWELLHDPESYRFRERDDRAIEVSKGSLGKTFPHPLAGEEGEAFYSALRYTPMGDELTLSFLKALVRAEKPGQSDHTDVLAISFSVTDYIGHAFGPNSLEAEDNLLRLDRTLQELFQFIDREVGLEKTLVVLSSDHGISPAPEHMTALGVPAGRHHAARFMASVNAALRLKYETTQTLALAFQSPGIYLDEQAIESLGIELADAEKTAAEEIMKVTGFSQAVTKSDLLAGRLPGPAVSRRAANSFHPVRSGNVILVQEPFWYLAAEPDGDTAMHGSPWSYDTHVPIMMAGPGIGRNRIDQRVAPRDVAPTISACLGIPPPSGATGRPLPGISPVRRSPP